ncbi:MAG TPA: TolC family protein [Verrucomicrobiae bacterium]|nr:TolC family protein [Verrucomicrobiae bacterium]
MKQSTFILSAVLCLAITACGENTNQVFSLDLAGAQKIALEKHPEIAAANYRSMAAQEIVKETRAGFFPSVNLFGTAAGVNEPGARILAGGLNNPSVYDRAAGGVAASQLITDFGQTANLTASSKFRAQAEQQNANATREQILLEVAAGYFNVLKAQSILNVSQQTLDTRQLLFNQVELQASNKLKSELDVAFARVALAEAQLLLQKARNDANAAMISFSSTLGYHDSHTFALAEPPEFVDAEVTNVEQLVQTALDKRPELASLRDRYQAALRLAKSQGDARLPVISAVGVAGDAPVRDDHLSENYAAGALQLNLPLFEGGRLVARERESQYQAQADNELLRAVEDNIVRDVHLAVLNVNDSLEEYHSTQDLARNAAEAYQLAAARYKIGSSSIVELSQAQLALTSAQIGETGARYNVMIERANLDYQTGLMQ